MLHRCAALALQSIDRRVLYGQEVRVNWASQRDTRPDTSNHFHIFIGDLVRGLTVQSTRFVSLQMPAGIAASFTSAQCCCSCY